MSDINEEVKSFFTKEASKSFKCKICLVCYKGGISNMRDHLSSLHPDESARLNLTKRKRQRTQENSDSTDNLQTIPKKVHISFDLDPNKVK